MSIIFKQKSVFMNTVTINFSSLYQKKLQKILLFDKKKSSFVLNILAQSDLSVSCTTRINILCCF